MKYLLFLILFLAPVSAYALAPDHRICNCSGVCAKISAAGELMISASSDGSNQGICSTPDRRISDNDGNVAKVTNGILQTG